jgi:hypothetical protein
MLSFDPMAVAIDWLDAYRAASLSIADFYAEDATLECGGGQVLVGRIAIAAYWQRRFADKPAGELEDLQPDGAGIVISYRVPDGVVQTVLVFDHIGKIERSRCVYL